jgi:hypothetical protein
MAERRLPTTAIPEIAGVGVELIGVPARGCIAEEKTILGM